MPDPDPPRRHTLIQGGMLLDLARRRLHRAELLLDRDRIAAVLPPGGSGPDDAARIDAADRLLLPGLVNAHTHGHGHLGKGSGDAWNLELLLCHGPWLAGGRSHEDRELGCLLGGLDMIRGGVTACYDLLLEPPVPSLEGLQAAARGYARAGVRVTLAPMIADRSLYDAIPGLLDAFPPDLRRGAEAYRAAPVAATLAALRGIVAGWQGEPDRARLALAPTIPLHCSDELILGCHALAQDHGLGLHMHLAESRVQALSGPQVYGASLTRHLASLGVLGPRFTAAHGVWLDAADIDLLADAGAGVAHNPGSNLRLGSGIAPARALLDRGVRLGIGTDGAQCSDHQNMFEAMRLAALASRVRSPDPARWVRSEEALAAATTGGAALLGFGATIGRLDPGCKADIVFLDLTDPTWIPVNDPVTQLVLAEGGQAVESVMIDGRFAYRHRRFPGIDLAALRDRAEARAADLRARMQPARDATGALAQYVSAFCCGLLADPVG
jgi:5-methylthioadenosine/S-adenosylhomocysteine deaminase